ncbi:hypothetical protein V6N12_063270 [Hibiscus sabdariffa]|uniref:Uncharacterized protein n=1 Tax=Hibiscus sabdariffa TaxID=183260 RepID=A0ABR2FBB6_9ROSI
MKYEKVELISLGPSKPSRLKVELSIPEQKSSQPKPPPEKVGLSIPEPMSSLPKPPPKKVVKEQTQKRISRRTPDVAVKYFDNTCDRYNWLLPDWIAEERFVPTGHRSADLSMKQPRVMKELKPRKS